MKKSIVYEKEYNGLSINTDKKRKLGCRTDILDRHHAHLNDMTDKHSKVLQVRLDLHYPSNNSVIPNSEHISNFTDNMQRSLRREKNSGGHKVDPRMILAVEKHDGDNPHIHAIILVNGNAKKSYRAIGQKAERLWGQALGTQTKGLVDYCDRKRNGIVISRQAPNFEAQLGAASYQGSYVAKDRGKDDLGKGTWALRGTRAPKKKAA